MIRKGNYANFEGNNISETGKPTPTKIGVHELFLGIHSYLHEFTCMNSIPTCRNPFLLVGGINISETGKPTPTKIDVHVLEINPYLYVFLNQF